MQPPGQKNSTGHNRFKIKPAFSAPIPPISSTLSEVQSPEADTSAPLPPPITIYFKNDCIGGALLDTGLLPVSVEDATPITLTKSFINKILSASHKPEAVLARLGALRGDEMAITYLGTTYTIKLPQVLKPLDLESVFQAVVSTLGCCHNLFSLDSVKKECNSCDVKPSPAKRKPPAEQEAATSTTPGDNTSTMSESPLTNLAKIPTGEWGIEEVIQFIESIDTCLGVHADLFRKHEIDGKAFLLLNSDMMMKYMGLKLGPALKICNLVSRLKGRRYNSL